MTQLEMPRAGKVSPEMKQAAAADNMDAEKIRKRIASGRAVLPKNTGHRIEHNIPIVKNRNLKFISIFRYYFKLLNLNCVNT